MSFSEAEIQSAAGELIGAVELVLRTLRGEHAGYGLEHTLEALSLYAWSGQVPQHGDVGELLTELSVAGELLTGSLIDTGGHRLVTRETVELIERIQKAADARYNIDNGGHVTMEGLAALAGVTDRAVRAATSSKNPRAMPITKRGHWTFIAAEHALAWLTARSDFIPTQATDRSPRAAVLLASPDVGTAWRQWRTARDESVEAVAEALAWSPDQLDAYRSVEGGARGDHDLLLTPQDWQKLAVHFGSDEAPDVAAVTYRKLLKSYADWRIAQTD